MPDMLQSVARSRRAHASTRKAHKPQLSSRAKALRVSKCRTLHCSFSSRDAGHAGLREAGHAGLHEAGHDSVDARGHDRRFLCAREIPINFTQGLQVNVRRSRRIGVHCGRLLQDVLEVAEGGFSSVLQQGREVVALRQTSIGSAFWMIFVARVTRSSNGALASLSSALRLCSALLALMAAF